MGEAQPGSFDHLKSALADRYLLERELGAGGMATVYLAQDLRHKRHVALKVLHSGLAATLGPDRFRREIETTARLQHPHICSVYDSGETAGHLWFTMPYVRGESLRARLRREGRLPLVEALRITAEAGRALDYAHREGVVHRDVKPENLLLTTEGDTLVADFGIGRTLASADSETQDHLTQTGVAIGTPAYMAPEQATAEPTVDARADQYALAVTCFEMLLGELPFTGPTPAALVAQRLTKPVPSVLAGRPEVPQAVDLAIQRALALQPERRFASIGDFVLALTSESARTSPRRRPVRLLLGALALAALAAGTVSVLRRSPLPPIGSPTAPAVIRLAVLPFENLGDSADVHFADGVADAVRGKLSALPSLQVIASTSSDQYRRSTKTPQQIGRELGTQYLLVGKVRWQKEADGTSRVQVSPELIQASTATTRWQQPFDAPVADVFRVQVDIASQVADALDLALASETRQHMGEPPTRDLAAYDAFLRGERLSNRVAVTDPSVLRRAVAAYEEAVALDSSFALAWAQLSRAHSTIYVNGRRTPDEAEAARTTAERALALGPDLPQAYFAQALYLSGVRREHAGALEVVSRGRRLAPGDAELLSMAGLAEQQLGRWDEALAHFREARSVDPRSLGTIRRLARVLLWLRRYPEAREASNYALRVGSASPDVLDIKLATFLAQGDLAGARAALRDSPTELDPTRLMAHTAWYFNLYWILDDDQQRLLLRLSPGAFDNDRGMWGLALAQTHALRGNAAAARAYADSARTTYQSATAVTPEDGVMRSNLGLALAIAGHRTEAVREGELAVKLEPIATNGITGPIVQHTLVLTHLALDEKDAALDRLEPLLEVPYYLSPDWLRIDPTFAPLRDHPRFEHLLQGQDAPGASDGARPR